MSIDTDTPLLPILVADTVIEQLALHLRVALPDTYAERLAAQAERTYLVDELFRRKLQAQGNDGRDALYVAMRHWLAGYIAEDCPELYQRLPSGFERGLHPVTARAHAS